MKTRKAEKILMVDEDLRFINFVSFTFAEMNLRRRISNLHHPLQFKLDDVSYRYWQKIDVRK
jgi:predicted methyltransferase